MAGMNKWIFGDKKIPCIWNTFASFRQGLAIPYGKFRSLPLDQFSYYKSYLIKTCNIRKISESRGVAFMGKGHVGNIK